METFHRFYRLQVLKKYIHEQKDRPPIYVEVDDKDALRAIEDDLMDSVRKSGIAWGGLTVQKISQSTYIAATRPEE